MFYDPTPPLSSSWSSEWSERMNRPSHYDDMEWGRPFREYTGSYTSPRIRRFDIADDSPRTSRTSSRSDVESMPEVEDINEQEGKPPRVHRIPIMVECRGDYQSTSRPQTPESTKIQEEPPRFMDFNNQQSNTVPRRRRRNVNVVDDDIQRSQSQSSNEPMHHRFVNREPQERRRRNVTTVKVNYEPEESREKAEEPREKPKESEIECVIREVDDLKKQVENLTEIQDKPYRYLDEMLTRCMLKLDNIDTMGSEDIRLARKNAIGRVQSCIDLLELKAHPPAPQPPPSLPSSPGDENQKKDCDNSVISLPFYNEQQQPCCKDGNNDTNNNNNRSVIVLPYYETAEVMSDDVTDADSKKTVEEKTPENVEKNVIVLPYYENTEENKNVIALPYHETTGCNDSCSESYCTKL